MTDTPITISLSISDFTEAVPEEHRNPVVAVMPVNFTDGSVGVRVEGMGFPESPEGVQMIAGMLTDVAEALTAELARVKGEAAFRKPAEPEAPARPRFNPKPRGAQ